MLRLFSIIAKSDMSEADTPVGDDDKKVGEGEESDEYLVCRPGGIVLRLLTAPCEPDIDKNTGIAKDGSNNEDILDDDPDTEGRDTNSYGGAGGDGGHQESGEGEEQSDQETHPARNYLHNMLIKQCCSLLIKCLWVDKERHPRGDGAEGAREVVYEDVSCPSS